MKTDRLKRLRDLHTWIGVVFGLFIFIVSLSGTFALFGDEIRTWEDAAARIPLSTSREPAMPILEGFVAEVTDGATMLSLDFHFPTAVAPFFEAHAFVRADGDRSGRYVSRRWHPGNGGVLPERGAGAADWIIGFHRELMLPSTLGKALVGLSGILMTLSILTGLVIHRKLIREAFTWRLDRSIRLRWQDSHKALTVWGLPFHIMIAFTGAWLGFVALLVQVIAALSFQGDSGAIFEAVFGPQPRPAGVSAPMHPIQDAARAVTARMGVAPESVEVSLWSDRNARYVFHYSPDDALLTVAQVTVDGVTGDILDTSLMSRPGLAQRVLGAMTSLHFAEYVGLWVKFLYALLGIGLCIAIATGIMIWLERKLHAGSAAGPAWTFRVLSRLTVGVCLGMVPATAAILHADKLMVLSPDGRMTAIASTYLGIWGAGILYAVCRADSYRSCRDLLAVGGIAFLALPAVNAGVTGQNTITLFEAGLAYAGGTDVAFGLIGLGLMVASRTVPRGRSSAAAVGIAAVRGGEEVAALR